MTWPQKSWGHTAWVMLPRSCTEVKWIEVKWIEVKWFRYLWLSSGNWGQKVSLSRDLSLRSNIGQNEVKSGRFSTNWWGLVSLVPERKSKFRVLNHLTATPVCRFHYFSIVHDVKCITSCQNCIFRALFSEKWVLLGINCSVSVSENLYFQLHGFKLFWLDLGLGR